MRRVVCEFSGGADSTLAAIWAKKKYEGARFVALFVDYGQKYMKEERAASYALWKKIFTLGNDWREVSISTLLTEWSSTTENVVVAKEYFPLRNLIIASLAASIAVQYGADVIVNGSKSLTRVPEDPYSFRDSTLPFYKLMEAAINGALEEGYIKIDTILAEGRERKMQKIEVFRELLSARIAPELTWSCYHPINGIPCGACRNCEERDIIFQQLKAEVSEGTK